MVEIQLDRDLAPEMLALANSYSQYLLDVAFNSSSIYVAKLYLFVRHWRDKTKKSVMISELKEWLGLEDKYEKSKDFRKRILDPAIKELKNRADVWFEIDKPIKLGKPIVGYIFRIYTKSNTSLLSKSYVQNRLTAKAKNKGSLN
jgi:plasmid replication initiation protein